MRTILRCLVMMLLGLTLMPSARAAESVTGTYKIENGEVLVQQTTDGRVKFSLNATYKTNVGEVSGEVPLNRNATNYADRDTDCSLTFKFAPGKLVVKQMAPPEWASMFPVLAPTNA